MTIPDLTERQRAAIVYLTAFKRLNGRMPTRRQLAAALELNGRSDPAPVLGPLRRKGYVRVLGAGKKTGKKGNLTLTRNAAAYLVKDPAKPAEEKKLLELGSLAREANAGRGGSAPIQIALGLPTKPAAAGGA